MRVGKVIHFRNTSPVEILPRPAIKVSSHAPRMPLKISEARSPFSTATLVCSAVWCGVQSIAVPWSGCGHDAQHTGISAVEARDMNMVRWQTPDSNYPGFPGVARESCINTAAVDPIGKCAMVDGCLTLSFVPRPAAADVHFSIEGCPDLTARSTGDVEAVTLSNPIPPTRLTCRCRLPADSIPSASLRLRIDRLR